MKGGHPKEKGEEREEKEMIENFLKGQVSLTSWNLTSNKKTEAQLEHFFSNLHVEHNVKTIRLTWNLRPNIICLVSLPTFSALRTLNLGGNNIHSLEDLPKLQAEHLQNLDLWNNKLTNLSLFRKVRFPCLRKLDLSLNQIVQIGQLWQLYASELEWISFDQNKLSLLRNLSKLRNFSQKGRVLICSNRLVKVFGCPAKRGSQNAVDCTFKNSLQPEINYS